MKWSYQFGDVIEVASGFHKGLIGAVVCRRRFFWYIVTYGFGGMSAAKIPVWRMKPHMRKPERRLMATLEAGRGLFTGKELLCSKSTFEQLEAELESADVVRVIENGKQVRIYGIDVQADDRVAISHPQCSFVPAEELDSV